VSNGTCTGLTNGTSYSISVTATGAGGTSGAATTTASPVAPPTTPTGLAATPSDGTITLNWADVPNATSSGATCTGLTKGTTYNVSVTATGAGGTSGAATVSAVPAMPVKKGGSKYTATVGWTSNYSPTTGYTYSSCSVSPATTGVSCDYSNGSRGASDALTLSTLSTAPSGSVVTLTWTFTTGGRNPKTYTESEVFVIS